MHIHISCLFSHTGVFLYPDGKSQWYDVMSKTGHTHHKYMYTCTHVDCYMVQFQYGCSKYCMQHCVSGYFQANCIDMCIDFWPHLLCTAEYVKTCCMIHTQEKMMHMYRLRLVVPVQFRRNRYNSVPR